MNHAHIDLFAGEVYEVDKEMRPRRTRCENEECGYTGPGLVAQIGPFQTKSLCPRCLAEWIEDNFYSLEDV